MFVYVATKRPNQKHQKEVSRCAHCGDSCYTGNFQNSELSFCCQGCETVFNLLQDHDLGLFYDLDEKAGKSQKKIIYEQYDYLDDPDLIQNLCSYSDGAVSKIWFSLPTIHCTSCLWLLENIPRINGGITSSTVNYLEKKALIQFNNDKINLRELVELLTKIGYPPHISLKDSERKHLSSDLSLIYKLGISGFVFGNIMLLSFPEYLGLSDGDVFFSAYLRYINVFLSLPIIFYCSSDYFASAIAGLKQHYLNIDVPISLGIFALFFKSIYDIFSGSGPGYLDSLAGLVFFLLVGKWFQNRTYHRIKFDLDYKSYFPLAATLLKDEKECKITLQKIKPKDRLRVRHGELIPADGILISRRASIDYSFVTGENDTLELYAGDQVYSGGIVDGEMVEVQANKQVNTSYLTQLWNDVSFKDKIAEGNISRINTIVAKYFTLAILTIASLSFVYHAGFSLDKAVNVFTSVLIIACPCAVALSIPFTFGNLTRLLAAKKIFFKNTKVVEKCSKINFLVFDKTGTITQSKNKKTYCYGRDLSLKEERIISSLARQSSHNASKMIARHFEGNAALTVDGFKEFSGQGTLGVVLDHQIKIGSRSFFTSQKVNQFEHRFPEAKRSNVYLELDNRIVASFKKSSSFINNLSTTLSTLSSQFKISLISGDNQQDSAALTKLFPAWREMQFEKSPFEKLKYIKGLQNERFKVAMIGDGLNDAGALSQSNIGIAVTENTSNFTPACDIILDASKFESLPALFSVCRAAIRIIYASYTIAICYNLVGLSFAVQGLLSPLVAAILMPLSSITVVVFGFVSSNFIIKKSKI